MIKAKDIMALGVLAVASFPIVLMGVLLWTGNVRLVFGPEAHDPNARSRLLERPEDIPGATRPVEPASEGKTAQEQPSSEDLDRREAELLREETRVSAIRQDAAAIRDTIRLERQRLEALLGKGDSLQGERIAVLASTFSSMKPDAAAKILVALDDILVTSILRKVPDDKPRAKILAAVGKLDNQRAGRISRLLSLTPKGSKPTSEEPSTKAPAPSSGKDTAKSPSPAKPDSTSTQEKKP